MKAFDILMEIHFLGHGNSTGACVTTDGICASIGGRVPMKTARKLTMTSMNVSYKIT